MSTLALVPVKDLQTAKSRLSPALDLAARRQLVLEMLTRTVAVLRPQVDGVVVVSPDADVLRLAREVGAGTFFHAGRLNPALEAARLSSVSRGATRLLVALGDLPLLTTDDVRAVLSGGADVVIAPDHAEQGTNLLFLVPPLAIPFQYGAFSCQRHAQAARGRGLRVAYHRSPTSALDVDVPADLAAVPVRIPVSRWG